MTTGRLDHIICKTNSGQCFVGQTCFLFSRLDHIIYKTDSDQCFVDQTCYLFSRLDKIIHKSDSGQYFVDQSKVEGGGQLVARVFASAQTE